ncbi:MAG: hypothetical protein ABIZ91_09750 [Gemmatimonadaceae bacterium]
MPPDLFRNLARVAVLAAAGTLLTASPMGAQQLGYTLLPTASLVTWDDNLPLEDRWLYGGRLSLLFGPLVELQPFYMRGNKLEVDSARGAAVFGPASLARSLRVEHYGTNIQFNLGDNDVSPFLRVGGRHPEPRAGLRRACEAHHGPGRGGCAHRPRRHQG